MTKQQSRRAIARDFDALSDAEALLQKYPDVTATERDRIGHFLRRGSPIDIGLLSSSPDAWRAAETFKADHPGYFKFGAGVYVGWLVALVLLGVGLAAIKDMGLP